MYVDSYPSEPKKNRTEELLGHEPAKICTKVGGWPRFPNHVYASRSTTGERTETNLPNLHLLPAASIVLFGSREILLKCSTNSNDEMDRRSRFQVIQDEDYSWDEATHARRRSRKIQNCQREFANCFLLFSNLEFWFVLSVCYVYYLFF